MTTGAGKAGKSALF